MASIGIQFVLYSFVGGAACCVDVGLFFLLTQIWEMHPILATSISFSAATVVNFYLCFKFIFAQGTIHPLYQILRTFFVAIVGFFFNALGLALFVRFIPIPVLLAKLLVIPFVMIWNFWSRRTFVHAPEIPPATIRALAYFLGPLNRLFFKLRR